jgi:hypothetical protein
MMNGIILSLLLALSSNLYAKGQDSFIGPEYDPPITSIDVSKAFDLDYNVEIKTLVDLIDKETKVNACVQAYVEKQGKSYARVVQENLYDLIHNFDKISSKIRGKKPEADPIPYDEKISALARVQCEAYYKMGVLK